MTIRNDREYFYKYYSPHSSKMVLAETSRKWSNPAEFNDPFDNQFDLHLNEDKDSMVRDLFNKSKEKLLSHTPIPNPKFSPIKSQLEFLRQAFTSTNLTQETIKELEEELMKGAIEGVENVIASFPKVNQEFRSALQNTSIFCLTETNDNLLMWAHYADNHSGTVIKFLSTPEGISPLPLAERVEYLAEMPKFNPIDFLEIPDFSPQHLLKTFTLTKGIDWKYEEEWRIVVPSKNPTENSGIFQFNPEELGAVYLGCKMTEDDKKEIIEITSSIYPKAEIYQAKKHEKEFKLEFEKIN